MHLYIITRGIKHDVDRFVNDMLGKQLPLTVREKPGYIQVAMRPIQLWEIVFPKDHIHTMMNTIWPHGSYDSDNWRGKCILKPFQVALNTQPMPEFDFKKPKMLVWNANVASYPIGIKEDETDKYGDEIL